MRADPLNFDTRVADLFSYENGTSQNFYPRGAPGFRRAERAPH